MQAEKFIKRILLKLKQFLGGKRNRDRAGAELFLAEVRGKMREHFDKLSNNSRRMKSPKKWVEFYSSFFEGTRKTSIKPSGNAILRNFSSLFTSRIQSLMMGITICVPAKFSTK